MAHPIQPARRLIWACLLLLTAASAQVTHSGVSVEITLPEEVKLSEILIAIPEPASDAQISQAQAKAEALRNAIRRGEKFENAARTKSQGPSTDLGGNIGYFPRGKLPPTMDDLVFGMKVGEVSDVVRTNQGFVILKVTDHLQPGVHLVDVADGPIPTEWNPYFEGMIRKILERWYAIIPYSAQAPTRKQGTVLIKLTLHRADADVVDEMISASSGDNALDEAASRAIRQAIPFPKFPEPSGAYQFVLNFQFEYNPPRKTSILTYPPR